jgi:hypothetical protein
VDRPVGAHGEGRPKNVCGFGRACGEGDDVGDGRGRELFGVPFTEADGFFDGDFVEGVEGVFEAGEGEARVFDARF